MEIVVTTKKDLKKMITDGCLTCGSKENFMYYSSSRSYECCCCGSKYLVDIESLLNLLSTKEEDNIRFYRNSYFPDDEKQDFVGKIKVKKKNYVLTTKHSEK